ncbi:MAG: hypothetical protein NTZ14_18300 [Hyphomicrobiales bacterium]|nr:hypothetical protein [Hyphomicrobiales bacterium]
MKIDFSTDFFVKYKIAANAGTPPRKGEPLLLAIGDSHRAVEIRCRRRQELGSDGPRMCQKREKPQSGDRGFFVKR